jgi:hypothetical protein
MGGGAGAERTALLAEARAGDSESRERPTGHEALDRLMARDERQRFLVSPWLFAGPAVPETAEVLDVAGRTVEGDWRIARARLRGQLGGDLP